MAVAKDNIALNRDSIVEVDIIQEAKANFISGRTITAVLFVSPNGDGTDGSSWAKAYTTIQAALDAASTDADDCTLIMIGPHATYYDINTTGDPTWSANVVLQGSYRMWAQIRNDHGSATSILKLTGRTLLNNLCFMLGTGSNNGVILTASLGVVRDCHFMGESLTGAATGLHFDGASLIRGHIVIDVNFYGHVTHFTGLLIDKSAYGEHQHLHFHQCLTAIQIVDSDSDYNVFHDIDIGDCNLGIDIDAGNEHHFVNILFHHNTTNVDDEVKDTIWSMIRGAMPINIEPDNFTGVQLNTHANPDTWGTDTEVRATATATKPFRIIAVHNEQSANEKYRVRFSADSGSTFYDDIMVDGDKRESSAFPSGTEFIFNEGTRISASAKSVSGGNNIKVWLEIQVV